LSEVILQSPAADRPALAREFRPLWQRSVQAIVVALGTPDGLPAPSPDYWEVPEKELTLGTVAPLLAGLRSAGKVQELGLYPEGGVGVPRLRERADALSVRVRQKFSPRGYQRYPTGGGSDSAVTFLLPPFADQADPQVRESFALAKRDLARPAGGLAPGAKWKRDGISWTPETALFGLAAAGLGDRQAAAETLDWLDRHRTRSGALPEKVLATGEPAAVAPLTWTAALVLLTLQELGV
ncbi:MAG: glycoside hydrolase family 15, partial [Angustibacter sp.]